MLLIGMKFIRAVAIGLVSLLVVAAVARAHDMFLRPELLFVREGSIVLVRLLNGTFSRSENAISRDRLTDVAIVSPLGRSTLDTAQWTVTGDTSTFRFTTGPGGTYVLGVSTKPRQLELKGLEFNAYLRDDGIPDELSARTREGRLLEPSNERYHKHVKALVQVGDTPSREFSTVLGYPAEIVPLVNPYSLKVGGTLPMRLLVRGEPVANQYVLYGGRTASEGRVLQRSTRSDAEGVVRIPLRHRGTHFVKFIRMARLTNDPELANYESLWSTLVFGVK
ncbi:MAG: DUF4198 domain-containing protein [Gemmatimonadaceae bacterium]